MPIPGAPTVSAGATPSPTTSGASTSSAAAVAAIPFTRAARKKRRQIAMLGPYTLGASQQQLPPLQIPAAGYIRDLILDVTITSAGNAATVAFTPDSPFSVLQNLSLSAANGDSLINPIDGFSLYVLHKYGCFSYTGARDPLADPTYSKVTGSGATAGSAHFQLRVPFEFDSRDAAGALPNMAANQSFLLNLFLNSVAGLYSTAPTSAPTVQITVLEEYWAAPAPSNQNGTPQATAPANNGLVSLIQTQTPPITAGTDQTIQLTNVGNTIRLWAFIIRNASGVRTDAAWPATTIFSLNNDVLDYKTKNNWQLEMAEQYKLDAGVVPNGAPALNTLDAGVYVYTEFINDGTAGDQVAQGSSNRDLMLVTGSGTGLNVEFQNFGGVANNLLILTNSLRIPDPASFYAPSFI